MSLVASPKYEPRPSKYSSLKSRGQGGGGRRESQNSIVCVTWLNRGRLPSVRVVGMMTRAGSVRSLQRRPGKVRGSAAYGCGRVVPLGSAFTAIPRSFISTLVMCSVRFVGGAAAHGSTSRIKYEDICCGSDHPPWRRGAHVQYPCHTIRLLGRKG